MSLDGIAFRCDGDDCDAWCHVRDVSDVETAQQQISLRYGWSTRDGEDFCRGCTARALGESV
ncbi:hypothetical protein ACIBHX_01750 [Nonomuraea sp. NPDC050536]|uniref:hypothetical protein n=1 Tax=Nonomuraea sp. NPDC050536 TaxID=3364366 RepID=UPI0037C6666A